VHGPGHVLHAPVVRTLVVHLLFLLAFLGRNLLPSLIFLLLQAIRYVLLVPCLLTLLWLAVVLTSCSGELGRKLELPLQGIKDGGHGDDLVIVRRFGSPGAFGAKVVELGLGHSHKGLVGQGRELPVEVVFVHPVDVTLEVVARDDLVGQEEDPNWVVNSGAASNNW
jgi:hypothetical protein